MSKTIDYLGRAPGLDAQEDSSYYDPDDTYDVGPEMGFWYGMSAEDSSPAADIFRLHCDATLMGDIEEELHDESSYCDS